MAADDTKGTKADAAAPAAPPSSGGREERAADQRGTAAPQVPAPPQADPSGEREESAADKTSAAAPQKAAQATLPNGKREEAAEHQTSNAPPQVADRLTEALPRELTEGLQVEVRFQLGELILPLKALANLQPEQVLTPLNGFAFPKVKALSAGRVFAEGELVRVGERIGFRVTKLYN